MSEMTHDEFLELLAGLEPGDDGERRLPEPAARHAAACADCARAAEALELLAGDEDALFDEPPAAYWESFDERLSARLEAAGRSAPARAPSPAALKLAAALLLALGLGALALRGLDGPASRQARSVELPAGVDEGLDAEELLDAWEGEPELPFTESALAVPAEDELPGPLGAPLEALHQELADELDESQATELARLLREEIES